MSPRFTSPRFTSPGFTSPRFTSPVQSSPVREIQYADKLLVFVVKKKKISALLIKRLAAGSLFNGPQVTLSRGAKNHIYLKNVLVVAFLLPI